MKGRSLILWINDFKSPMFHLTVEEYRVADEIPWGVGPSGSVPTSWRAALWASRMCKDNACKGCSYLISLCVPDCQRCRPLFSLCRRLGEGFSTGALWSLTVKALSATCTVCPSANCLSVCSCFARPVPALLVSCSSMRSTLSLAHDHPVRQLIAHRRVSCLCF